MAVHVHKIAEINPITDNLCIHRDCTTYESIRTVNRITYSSFQNACYSMRLLCDARKFITTINEVAELASGHQLRKLFVMLLISNSVSKPDPLNMTDDELKTSALLRLRRYSTAMLDLYETINQCHILSYLMFAFFRIS
ncbi:hypothetical protein Ahy_B06g083235 [Arachis hypogaea]|uniref:Uncharacterized protein n=1 Tax=Arachis hypogaea TaxID=3818 RepID=A0A444YPG2_ARAHY|nr:hypothetical protein Ahy_B06g083235 [Arachis hypogaea]